MSDHVDEIAAAAAEAAEAGHELTGERLRELIEKEAIAAEMPPDDDEEGDGTDEPEVAPTDPMMIALSEYVAKVQEIVGDSLEIRPCVFCHGFGFNPVEVQQDTHSDICVGCAGQGVVATGSLVKGNETRMCQDCRGAGFIPHAAAPVEAAAQNDFPAVRMLTPDEITAIQANAERMAAHSAG